MECFHPAYRHQFLCHICAGRTEVRGLCLTMECFNATYQHSYVIFV